MRYRTFTKDWYEATVIIGGKKQTGYIHKNDIEAPDTDSKSFRGIALNNNTHVYAEGSTSSKILRSYHVGSVLQYKSYSENWYQATVILNGKKVTGFIQKTHVKNGKEGQPTLNGVTQRNSTPIYQRASKSSPILRRHKIGDIIEYTALTNEWYETKVYSGKQVSVGYVYHTDIATEVVTYTNYGISLQKALEIQTENIGKYPIEQYHSYIDPNNHNKLQHVRLDKSIGVSATQLNKILAGLGTLGRQGQAFINGGKKHGINEAYLIAHAIHETGRGQSALAQGIEVGINSKGKATMVTNSNRKNLRNIRTTYNMFGIGAIDKDANKYGSETAYENGWFSPQAAIEGGANWISGQYIQNEHQQNTLYKMRWNPNMAFGYHWKQYATDPGWAVKQTVFIENIYKQLDNPIYHYDMPVYR